MGRLVDADAWDIELMSYGIGQAIIGRKIKYTVAEVRSALAKRPTVDAVEVVRCKECKFASLTYDGECKYCQRWKEKYDGESVSLYLDGDFYCAFAERKEDGNNDNN